MTASEARRNWFRLLDEVAAGAVVVVERAGRRILIRREGDAERTGAIPDYASLIRAPAAERAEEWNWKWSGPEGELVPGEGGLSPDRDDALPAEGRDRGDDGGE